MNELLKTILSASVVAGMVTFFGNQWSQRRQNRLAHVREQLEKLYGPLVFFVRMNATIWEHHKRLVAYGEKELGEKAPINWSDPAQVERNSGEIDMLIVVQNDYGATITENNKQMVALIRSNYHLVDAEDQDVCREMVLNVLRLEIEAQSKLAKRLYGFKYANPIKVLDLAFAQRIEASFAEKHASLRKLTGRSKKATEGETTPALPL